jgi:hypothetical protein
MSHMAHFADNFPKPWRLKRLLPALKRLLGAAGTALLKALRSARDQPGDEGSDRAAVVSNVNAVPTKRRRRKRLVDRRCPRYNAAVRGHRVHGAVERSEVNLATTANRWGGLDVGIRLEEPRQRAVATDGVPAARHQQPDESEPCSN